MHFSYLQTYLSFLVLLSCTCSLIHTYVNVHRFTRKNFSILSVPFVCESFVKNTILKPLSNHTHAFGPQLQHTFFTFSFFLFFFFFFFFLFLFKVQVPLARNVSHNRIDNERRNFDYKFLFGTKIYIYIYNIYRDLFIHKFIFIYICIYITLAPNSLKLSHIFVCFHRVYYIFLFSLNSSSIYVQVSTYRRRDTSDLQHRFDNLKRRSRHFPFLSPFIQHTKLNAYMYVITDDQIGTTESVQRETSLEIFSDLVIYKTDRVTLDPL